MAAAVLCLGNHRQLDAHVVSVEEGSPHRPELGGVKSLDIKAPRPSPTSTMPTVGKVTF